MQTRDAGFLDGISWQQFEMLVGEGFRQQGYQVVETGGGGADGGVDLILKKSGEKYLAQCKQWRAFKVGVEVVRELYGVMAAKGATGGFVVTSGRFTEEAARFAEGRNVELIDGARLQKLLRMVKAGGPGRAIAAASAQPIRPDPVKPGSPTCPSCGKPMALRLAKRGANAGQEFWGCTGYPSCRATRPAG